MPLHGFGVATELENFAKRFGGTASEFDQGDYIEKWIQAGKMSPQLEGGVCQGLSAMWIASRADWAVFKNIIQTPGGVSHVRGFMNLQHAAVSVGSLKDREAVTTYLIEQVRIFGVAYTNERDQGTKMDTAKVAAFAAKKSGFTYLNFYGDEGGHSVAFHNGASVVSFFDPNYGVAVFPGRSGFASFVRAFFPAAYADLDTDWWTLRFNAASGKAVNT